MTPRRPASSTVIHRHCLTSALCLSTALMAGCMESNMEDLHQFVAATKAASAGKALEPLPEIEPYQPFTYTAQGLKDPFAPSEFIKKVAAAQLAALDNGIRPDAHRAREELEKYSLGSLRMVGTFSNEPEHDLWALIKAPDGIVHRVQPGNYLGTDHGRILRITNDRIDLLEIIADGIRGWQERDAFLSLAE